ncbi:ABC transporter substrate-binding protein [Rhodomicrobium lacus]|uniref:ABC transporter substrate-binding protein n=1 Tax=Rhodomicrobium lacus TaxID=2498452 RepID=UPI0026E3289D|nr:ABC transporter substrate-binding protein [Rhodomicrobium lacus]WKW50293.1 ABC transporter substrate-binding protein [Rhodomicrobium lacus]
MKNLFRSLAAAVAGFLLLATATPQANAETGTVRIAKQFGISYLPLVLLEEQKLIEKHAKELGLDVSVEWLRFTGGSGMNEAILSGNLDFASGGVGPLLTIWGKTQNNFKVKGVTSFNAMPIILNTNNPNVKTIKDFTEKDKIALPAVKSSIQAVTLQIAAEKAFGKGQANKLDSITISLGHPDGQAALLSGKSEVTGHFTAAPFAYDELADPRVHKVLDSYEVLGGPHTYNSVWATSKFHDENPKVIKAFLAALEEAIAFIKAEPLKAAEIWVKAEKSKLTPEQAAELIKKPENEWTLTPKKIVDYADFMYSTGAISAKPASWKDVFFDDIHHLPGS